MDFESLFNEEKAQELAHDKKKLIECEKLLDSLRDVMRCWYASPYSNSEKNKGANDMLLQAMTIANKLPDKSIDLNKEINVLKEKLQRAENCINEISNQFERGKYSNDYVEDILREFYDGY